MSVGKEEALAQINRILRFNADDLTGTIAGVRTDQPASLAVALIHLAQVSVTPVVGLYQIVFGRTPDGGGLHYWVGRLLDGKIVPDSPETLTAITAEFTHSDEWKAFTADKGNAEIVTTLYRQALGREPDADGLAYWTGVLDEGGPINKLLVDFSLSPEFIARSTPFSNALLISASLGTEPDGTAPLIPADTPPAGTLPALLSTDLVAHHIASVLRLQPSDYLIQTFQSRYHTEEDLHGALLGIASITVAPVVSIYQIAFNRLPDGAGLDFWVNQLGGGLLGEVDFVKLVAIAEAFVHSDEWQQEYDGGSTTELVTALYRQALGRAPDEGGLAYWVDRIDNDGLSPATFLVDFATSAEFIARAAPLIDRTLHGAITGGIDPGQSLFPSNPADPSTVSIDVAHAQKIVNDSGEDTGDASFTFIVSRTGDTSGNLTVPFTVQLPEGFGVAEPAGGAVSFGDGETRKTITVKGPVTVSSQSVNVRITLVEPQNDSYVLKEHESFAVATATNDWRLQAGAHAEEHAPNDGPAAVNYKTLSGTDGAESIQILVKAGSTTANIFRELHANAQNNTVYGGDGDDTISISLTGGTQAGSLVNASAYAQNNTVYGGDGDDTISISLTGGTQAAANLFRADIFTNARDNTVYGGDGNDAISISLLGGTATEANASAVSNRAYGGDGDDTISISATGGTATSGDATANVLINGVYGGDGNDTIAISALGGTAAGGDGTNAFARAFAQTNKIYGGDGDDTISISATGGTATSGYLSATASAVAFADHNTIYGGDGDDTISISATVGTAAGIAYIEAHAVANSNAVYGGDGNDFIAIYAYGLLDGDAFVNVNTVHGGDGNDTIIISATATKGSAHVYGNTVNGGTGSDTFSFIGASLDVVQETSANVIGDFNAGEGDRIRVAEAGSGVNFLADAAVYNSYADALTAANNAVTGPIKYFFANVGSDGYLFYDLDGAPGADHAIKLTGVTTFAASSIEAVV